MVNFNHFLHNSQIAADALLKSVAHLHFIGSICFCIIFSKNSERNDF